MTCAEGQERGIVNVGGDTSNHTRQRTSKVLILLGVNTNVLISQIVSHEDDDEMMNSSVWRVSGLVMTGTQSATTHTTVHWSQGLTFMQAFEHVRYKQYM